MKGYFGSRNSTWGALALFVLAVVLVLVWLTRPAAIEYVPRTSAEVPSRSMLVEELAASDGVRRMDVATDSIEDVGAAAPLDPALGRVVVVHDGKDEPWSGDGCLCFTERVPGDLPRTQHVPIERGGFRLPEIAPNTVWTLEHGVLGKGAEAGAVQPAAPLEIVGGSDTSPREVRLEDFVEVEYDVLSGTNLDQLKFDVVGRAALSEVADVQFVGRTTGGADMALTTRKSDSRHRVEVPWTCESVRIDAPGHIFVRRAAPSACRVSSMVVLRPSQVIEVRCLALDAERDYELLIGDVFGASERHAVPRGDEVLVKVETAERAVQIALCEVGGDEVLDSTCVVEGVGTRVVVLEPGRNLDVGDATVEVHIRGVGAAKAFVLATSASFVERNGQVVFEAPIAILDQKSEVDNENASAVLQLAPGLVRVFREQDYLSGATYVLGSGKLLVVDLFEPELVEITVRCVDAATGDGFPVETLVSFSDANGARSATAPTDELASSCSVRLPRGEVRLMVMYRRANGSHKSPWFGPFHVEGGETIDLVVDRERYSWSIKFGGRALRPDASADEISVIDNGGGEALTMRRSATIKRDTGATSSVLLSTTIDPTCSSVYVVPPRDPQLGALTCGWLACVPGESPEFELVPATVD